RLRPDSATDAAYVRRLADRHGLPFHLAVAVDEPGRSDSVEMWGRFERAREAGKVALAIGASRMADGHTLDDQAETILMGHGLAVQAPPVLDLPPALSSRVARRGFQRADLAWDHEAIEAVLDLAAGSPGRTRDLLLGIKARRTRTHVEVEG